MKRFTQLAGIALLCSISAHAESPQPPVIIDYPMLCPSCSTERTISLRYGEDGTSVVETHDSAVTPQIAPANDDSDHPPGEWISGPMTGFKPGRIQRWEGEIGTDFIEVRDAPALEEGRRYVDNRLTTVEEEPGRASWSIDAVSVDIGEGDDDRVIAGYPTEHLSAQLSYTRIDYDADGEETESQEKMLTYELWMTQALPFSPLPFQYEPFQGNRVPPYMAGPVVAGLMHELTGSLQDRGGLVRASVAHADGVSAMEVAAAQEAPALPMERFSALPVVASAQVDHFAGPLFIASLLRAEMIRSASDSAMTLAGRELKGVSAWKVNEAGDLVVVLSAKDENTNLFLVRPVTGLPQPGRYDVTRRPAFAELRGMDEESLNAHSGKFQVYGIVVNDGLPTVLSGLHDGEVTIERTEDGVLVGSLSARVSALDTDSLSERRPMPIDLSFRAAEGLSDFRFRSPESRIAGR